MRHFASPGDFAPLVHFAPYCHFGPRTLKNDTFYPKLKILFEKVYKFGPEMVFTKDSLKFQIDKISPQTYNFLRIFSLNPELNK